jgi:UDP-2,3-diacylglucosamine hydrolase
VIVADYFASDVHLRFDHPERDRRFAAFLCRLNRDDALWIIGDLCDFSMGARHSTGELLRCESLQALARFSRDGGRLAMMAGNHDIWLGPFYKSELGADMIAEPYDLESSGVRVRLVHGHLLGARRPWKAWMESQAFFKAFRRLPRPIALELDRALTWRNERDLDADEERHLRVYRQYAASCHGIADLVVIGHVHRPVDEPGAAPRLIVLGGWQCRSSFLQIDDAGAQFHIEEDRFCDPTRPLQAHCLPSTHGSQVHEI